MTADASPYTSPDAQSESAVPPAAWYRRIGPGLITACVVIGPGSIMTSSTIGANDGYAMLWVVAVSVAFMLTYMTLGARLGAVSHAAPGDLIREKSGSGLAIAMGIGVFFISAAFQSGNNIGLAAAFEPFVGSRRVVSLLIVGFNLLAIGFLFVFKDLYKSLERLMTILVGLMLVSFAVNLVSLKPNLLELASGFRPSLGTSGEVLPVLGLIGTTFVITAAFYQAYLVRQKGWKVDDIQSGLIDARIGSAIMFLITLMLMSTAAAAFFGKAVELKNPVAVATALEATFGPSAKIIFCLGLFSAAYSSFLVNSMIGGFMASDGLGFGSDTNSNGPKIMTTIALLTGMSVGVAVISWDFDRTPTIIAAQAVTVIAAPLVAGVLLWLTSSRDIMGDHVNGPATKVFAGLGLLLLIAMAGKTAIVDIPRKISEYTTATAASPDEQPPATDSAEDSPSE